ncbi:hypothetical protein AMJ39_05750 [candidate division TA06 bacterium DG_24]|uniref:DUF5667 domain-containing protein n=3 Tax=Bacteria division TA06 TaxID=1156500 RepID=A0A0S8JJA7_UNCT6|nr:MAG: hypothetical protein AMJ39_05750 [candidate division TA06 bacterium DG_24]KPK68200.1 MAG: hypothetical protein AMJ82_08865 [candidate division TA06 bacterium SM23_40]KPL09458.1 MAG: hypothetical protein AMJ71_06345 [candidate division TA06 bacterium SM1_40]
MHQSTRCLPVISLFLASMLVFLRAPLPAESPAMSARAESSGEQPAVTFPELEAFHRQLLSVWYGPVRQEDWQAVRHAHLDLVKAKNRLLAVEVPEPLRDRATAYAAKRDLLDKAVEELAVASMWEEDTQIPPAIQKVYDSYYLVAEALGLQPMTFPAAVEAFQAVLHPLVRDALPQGDCGAVKKSLPVLRERFDAMRGTEMPASLEEEREQFMDRLEQLDVALVALEETCKEGEDAHIEQAFDMLHGAFVAIREMLPPSGEPVRPE